MICPGCGTRVQSDHDVCHIGYRKLKPYKQYKQEGENSVQSIIGKYGMPSKAQPPLSGDIIDRVISQRRIVWRVWRQGSG